MAYRKISDDVGGVDGRAQIDDEIKDIIASLYGIRDSTSEEEMVTGLVDIRSEIDELISVMDKDN